MIRRTLQTTYQNSQGSTIYVYVCCDGKDVWYEERLRQI